jgi:hypothetical protein
MDRDFAFYRSDLHMVSPLVSVSWRGTVVDLLNQLPDSAGGNMPEGWCVDFVAGCCGLPKIGRDRVALWNWWPQEAFDARGLAEGTPEYELAFVSWLDRQAKTTGDRTPVFISTWLPPVAYQGGAELCRLVVDGSGTDRRAVWVAAPRSRPKKKPAPRRER